MAEKQNLFHSAVASDNGLIRKRASSSAVLKLRKSVVYGIDNDTTTRLVKLSVGDITGLPAAATIADGKSRIFYLFGSGSGQLSWSYGSEATTGSEFSAIPTEITEYRKDKRLLALIDIHNASGSLFTPGSVNLDAAGITYDVYPWINSINDNIGTDELEDGAVTADKIGTGAVTEAKIDTGAVTADKIGTGAVTAVKIGTGAVTNDKILAPKVGVLQETIAVGDFTDNTDTTGTITLTGAIPVGAVVLQTLITNVVGFAGDTSAVVVIGDGTDTDRYNTGTPDVFTTADDISAGSISGTVYHDAAINPVVTVTSATDFTLVQTEGNGAMTLTFFYLQAD